MLLTPEEADKLVAETTAAHQEVLGEGLEHYTERSIYPVQGRLFQLVRTVSKEDGVTAGKYHLQDGMVDLPEVSMVPTAAGFEFRRRELG